MQRHFLPDMQVTGKICTVFVVFIKNVKMKQTLLSIIILFLAISANSQTDTTNIKLAGKSDTDSPAVKITIYPVPVRDGLFTIKSDKDISEIKITNIIGQNIYNERYDSPMDLIKISLAKPGRGIYLCAIVFSDGTRAVKKIMVERSE
jgi:hypothetical protein